MTDQRTSKRLTLTDGRILGYAEYGDPEGRPVFYCHGFPSSRLDWEVFHHEGNPKELDVRIIAVDRPGYGLSESKRNRTLLDWPTDLGCLADHLGITNYAVLGISGGGPYAAACAHNLNDRLTRAGIVCGMGPSNAPGMQDGASWTIPGTPSLMRGVILRLTSMGVQKDPEQFIQRSKETFSEPDRQLLDQPAFANLFITSMQEAFRQGVGGANQEAKIFTKPWGFNLEDITAEVYLWHGELDLNIPISVGRYMAEVIPNCSEHFYEAEGHFTLPYNHLREILGTLVK